MLKSVDRFIDVCVLIYKQGGGGTDSGFLAWLYRVLSLYPMEEETDLSPEATRPGRLCERDRHGAGGHSYLFQDEGLAELGCDLGVGGEPVVDEVAVIILPVVGPEVDCRPVNVLAHLHNQPGLSSRISGHYFF